VKLLDILSFVIKFIAPILAALWATGDSKKKEAQQKVKAYENREKVERSNRRMSALSKRERLRKWSKLRGVEDDRTDES